MRADRTAPLGLHTLSGKLTFQVVTNKGVSEPQSIDVQVRLTVVAHNAKVHRAAWPYHEMSHAQLVTLIVLSPVLVALFIPAIALCAIMTGSPLGCE